MKVKKGKSKRLKILIIAFIIIILLVGGFFGFMGYKNWRAERNLNIFKQGFTYGYTSAVMQIMNISSQCRPFPIYVGNQTKNFIAVDCLNNT